MDSRAAKGWRWRGSAGRIPGRPPGRSPDRRLLLCWALLVLCSCAPEVPDHSLRIQVLAAEPVTDARVLLWWLDQDGHPLRRDGRRSKDAELSASNALAEGQTDAQGVVELRTGPAYGLLALGATGGVTRDPWLLPGLLPPDGGSEPDASPGAGDVTVPNHVALRSVLVDFLPGPASRDVAITPLTTLAVTLGERRLAHPDKEDTYPAAMARAFDLLGTHFWGLDLTRSPAAGQSPAGFDTAVEYTLALHALAALAHRIAEASDISGRSFHTLTLLEALLRDAADDRALLDGIATDGPVVVGACPAPPLASPSGDCDPGDRAGDLAGEPACRSICALDANTLRARLASALAFDFLPSAHNQTGLSLVDARVLVEDLRTSIEPELFGDVDGAELDGPVPTIEVTSSPVHDERQDAIAFDEHAVPTHTPGPGSLVDLAGETSCPTVGKHIHRLADAGDNALRWHVIVRDRTGWSSNGDAPAPLQYRLEHRAPLSSPAAAPLGDDCSADPEQAWLTDWLSAEPMSSLGDDGILYEVVLLREHVPELAEVTEGELEIVFRGQDALGQEVVTCRCWNHVLLPAPLEVGPVTVATGVGSLQARSLFPGNNLAPLLNGVPLDEAVVLGSFEIRNGTDEPAYVRMTVEQPLVRFTKCWQRSNSELSASTVPDPSCVPQQTCLSTFPPDRQTAVVVDTGVIEHLITGLRTQDTTTPSTTAPCGRGDTGTHCIGPRLSPTAARIHRVELLVSNLGVLAPRTISEPPAFYFESTLEPPALVPITGALSEGIFHVCTLLNGAMCFASGVYQYYRSLVAAELVMADSLFVRVAMIPAPHLLLSPTLDAITKLESFAWSTHEQSLPPFIPVLKPTDPAPLCPIVERILR